MKLFLILIICLSLFSCSQEDKHTGTSKNEDSLVLKTPAVEQNKATTQNVPKESTDQLNQIFHSTTVNGYDLLYDCLGCKQSISGGIIVYAVKEEEKKKLFDLEIADHYLSEISLKYINDHPFIYVGTSHTYGHSEGYLYSLDTIQMEAHRVHIDKSVGEDLKIPDTLQLWKYFGLDISDENTFTTGASFRTKTAKNRYFYEAEYILRKNGNNFVLVLEKENMWEME